MAKFLDSIREQQNPVMDDLETIEERSTLFVVSYNNKHYGVSKRRIEESACNPDTELFISRDGKWLIPSDTTREAIQPDW